MGSGPTRAQKMAQDQNLKLQQRIADISAGKQQTRAQKVFERGLQETLGQQVGVGRSGFGGSVANRLRDIDTARANTQLQGNLAREILKDQELARLSQTKSAYDQAQVGAYSDKLAKDAAILGAATTAGAGLVDAFGTSGSKPKAKAPIAADIYRGSF